jgi:hypothetical protein
LYSVIIRYGTFELLALAVVALALLVRFTVRRRLLRRRCPT